MRHTLRRIALLLLVCGLLSSSIWSQQPRQPRRGAPSGKIPGRTKKKPAKEAPPARPTDPRLIEIHKEFLTKAEKLAEEFERKKQLDKAREVYEAVLRLVPKYSKAEQALDRISQYEAKADRKQLTVFATKGWQDSGVILIAGKPVIIEAKGSWTFNISHKLGPAGIAIPKELRDFNLGALIGVIVTGPNRSEKPFHIGAGIKFTVETSGRLMLRMYDSDPTDNAGQLTVVIQSTFAKKR